jgi:hypothetical protein
MLGDSPRGDARRGAARERAVESGVQAQLTQGSRGGNFDSEKDEGKVSRPRSGQDRD